MDMKLPCEFGDAIFEAFRAQQARRGNTGCTCSNCRTDMHVAVREVILNGEFCVERRDEPVDDATLADWEGADKLEQQAQNTDDHEY